MKLSELLENQRITIQLLWGEQKIEFFSNVIEKDESAVYVSPYLHNGSELELNVIQGKGVICNLFTNNPSTKRRMSWRNIKLTTVLRNEKTMYCLKTSGYNNIAKQDDRRTHERVIIQTKAKVYDGQSDEGVDIIVHDISDIGISFYAPKSFLPQDQKLTIRFSDAIDEKTFDVKLECAIARITNKAGNRFVGCRVTKENKDYLLYGFIKRLKDKNRKRIPKLEIEEIPENIQPEMQVENKGEEE